MRLFAVTNDSYSSPDLVEAVWGIERFVDGVILRERSKTAANLIDVIHRLLDRGFPQDKLIVNDRVDAAVICGLKKVQLPGHGLPARKVREIFPEMGIGRSVHSLAEADAAWRDGADWLLYGHVYKTDCKKGMQPRGMEELKKIRQATSGCLYAIGGIKPENMRELQNAGVDGVAVMSSIFDSRCPELAAQTYAEAMLEEGMAAR